MIVPLQEMLEYTGQSDAWKIEAIHAGIEKQVKSYLAWDPEEVVHTNKLYDGKPDRRNGRRYPNVGGYSHGYYQNGLYHGYGLSDLYLKEKYISDFTRVAERVEVIRIKNTDATAQNAYVTISVSDNLITLVVQGATDSSNTVSLTTSTTMTAVVTAINAIGASWSAEMVDTNFNNYDSTNLLDVKARFVGAWRGTDGGFVDFDMAGKPFMGVEMYDTQGKLYYGLGFPSGRKRIAVSYTSGYSEANMPDDLKLGIMSLVNSSFNRSTQGTEGISEYSLGHLRVKYASGGNGGGSSSAGTISQAFEFIDEYRQRVIV
jgi:hypothetical protein